MDKITRMNTITSTIENGCVHLPDKAAWLGEYLHELSSFPKAKFTDQCDSTSQALDWFKRNCMNARVPFFECFKLEHDGFDSPINRGALFRESNRIRIDRHTARLKSASIGRRS